ncbi:MAG: sodium ion-translocating decarboxylase subunit beta [Lachnospiraceae bacterium]|nr:sodium ion-translocating decarboxylase subunit beta [Lachnospiraceae bacterium]
MKLWKIIAAALPGTALILTGIRFKFKQAMAISIIGGADGPTSVFIAGKTGNSFSTCLIAAGILVLIATLIWIIRKTK